MSTAEVQVKVLTVADVSGIERAKASFTNLQGDIQKKMSVKGIGMSLLEGLGIGSGFRIADTITEQLVKPFKEAAEFAEKMANATQLAADATASLMRYRKVRLVGEEQALADEVADLQKKLVTAQATATNNVRVFDGVDSNGDQTMRIEMQQTEAEALRVQELAKQLAAATEAQLKFNDAKYGTAPANARKMEQETNKRIQSQRDEINELFDSLKKEEDALNKEGQAVRESIDAKAKLSAETSRLIQLYGRGGISAADLGTALAKLNAEFANPELMRKGADALAEYQAQLDKIDKNPLLTDKEKREARLQVLLKENEAIRAQIELWKAKVAADPSAQNQSYLKQLGTDLNVNEASQIAPASKLQQTEMGARNLGDSSQHYQGVGEGMMGGLMEVYNEYANIGDNVAESIRSQIGGAVQSVTQNMMGWINGTQTFGKALRNIGASVFQSFLQQIIQMGVQWLITQGLIKMGLISTHAVGESLKAASTASTMAQEGAKTPVLATNAGLASVSSFGVAAILGIALLIAGIAALAFESGGMIPGGEKLIRVNERGQESVLNARATSTLGAAFVNAVNGGDFAAAQQMMSPIGGLTRPGFSPELQAGGAGAIEAAANGQMHVAVHTLDAPHAVGQWADSRDGQKVLVNLIKRTVSRV